MTVPSRPAVAPPRHRRWLAVGAIMAIAVGLPLGCARTPDIAGPPSTLDGVGRLPEELSVDPNEFVPVLPLIDLDDGDVVEPIGDLVAGNRLLVIGDSIMASASRRYGDEICDLLVPLGWEVEVNAEVGRFVEFGSQVLRSRFDPVNDLDWDAIVISLGTNYNNDAERYRTALESILDRLEPRPVVLLTVTEWRSEMSEVNDVIVDVAQGRPDVRVIDWAAITGNDDGLLQRDGIHLTVDGRDRLARVLAEVLGTTEGEGICRDTRFSDDSAGGDDVDIGVTTTRPSGSSTTSDGTDDPDGTGDPGDDSGDTGGSGDTGDTGDTGGSGDTGDTDAGDPDSGPDDTGSGGSSTGTTSPAPDGAAPPSSDG